MNNDKDFFTSIGTQRIISLMILCRKAKLHKLSICIFYYQISVKCRTVRCILRKPRASVSTFNDRSRHVFSDRISTFFELRKSLSSLDLIFLFPWIVFSMLITTEITFLPILKPCKVVHCWRLGELYFSWGVEIRFSKNTRVITIFPINWWYPQRARKSTCTCPHSSEWSQNITLLLFYVTFVQTAYLLPGVEHTTNSPQLRVREVFVKVSGHNLVEYELPSVIYKFDFFRIAILGILPSISKQRIATVFLVLEPPKRSFFFQHLKLLHYFL